MNDYDMIEVSRCWSRRPNNHAHYSGTKIKGHLIIYLENPKLQVRQNRLYTHQRNCKTCWESNTTRSISKVQTQVKKYECVLTFFTVWARVKLLVPVYGCDQIVDPPKGPKEKTRFIKTDKANTMYVSVMLRAENKL